MEQVCNLEQQRPCFKISLKIKVIISSSDLFLNNFTEAPTFLHRRQKWEGLSFCFDFGQFLEKVVQSFRAAYREVELEALV